MVERIVGVDQPAGGHEVQIAGAGGQVLRVFLTQTPISYPTLGLGGIKIHRRLSPMRHLLQRAPRFAARATLDQVTLLAWILLQVEEERRGMAKAHVLPLLPTDHAELGPLSPARAERIAVDRALWRRVAPLQHRREICAVEPLGGRRARQGAQRWEEVDQADGGVARPGLYLGAALLGRGDDQRHVRTGLVPAVLPPHPMLARHLAVIGRIDDHGVVEEAISIQAQQQVIDHLIEVADAGKVSGPGAHHLLVRDGIGPEPLAHASAQGVIVRVASRRHARRGDAVGPIALDVTARCSERKVGPAERGTEEPGPDRMCAMVLAQEGHRLVGDDLVLDQALWDLGYAHVCGAGPHGVTSLVGQRLPLMPGLAGQIAVGTVLEPGKLAPAPEVHLADQAGLVACLAKDVSDRRRAGPQHGFVVPCPRAAHLFSSQDAQPRRGTERHLAVGVGEHGPACRQPVEGRRVDRLAPLVSRAMAHVAETVLIAEQKEDVGSIHGYAPLGRERRSGGPTGPRSRPCYRPKRRAILPPMTRACSSSLSSSSSSASYMARTTCCI